LGATAVGSGALATAGARWAAGAGAPEAAAGAAAEAAGARGALDLGGAAATGGLAVGAGAGAAARAAATTGSAAVRSFGDTTAVSRPISGTMRTRTMPRSAMYSNSVSVPVSIWFADSDGATSTSRA